MHTSGFRRRLCIMVTHPAALHPGRPNRYPHRPGGVLSIPRRPGQASAAVEGVQINAEPTAILLATDGTAASQNARAAAAHIARAANAALHIVHAWSPSTAMGEAEHVAERIASAVAADEAKLIEEQLGCPVAAVHTPSGSRAHAILATARTVSAGIIIVGGRRLGIVEELFTYRVSEDVVHRSFRPVLLVRDDGHAWPPRHVVVGCDGSAEANLASGLAAWLARLSGADLTLVTVIQDHKAAADAVSEGERRLALCAETARDHLDSERIATRVVTHADVPDALREACRSTGEPHLLAIGARGSSAGASPGFSVSRSITHHTHVPLLLVPPPTHERGDLRR